MGPSRAGTTSKRHIVCEGNGVPAAIHLSSGNRHNISQAVAALEKIVVPQPRNHPRTRPRALCAYIHLGLLQLAAVMICLRYC